MQLKAKSQKPGRAIRLSGVIELTGISPATVWRLARNDPEFPKPFHLTPAITVWNQDEIIEWLEAKMAARGAR